jgi:hypothetical protein
MQGREDYLKFYDDERYLLEEVGAAFRATGALDPADFYMVLVWKANRAKNYARERLKKIANGTFAEAVSRIAKSLYSTAGQKDRLRILIVDWEFSLPTATAILSLLYPDEFTVYDTLVCGEINHRYRPYLSFSDALWKGYEEFRQKVIAATPPNLTLRDRDRFLIGRATRKSIEKDCQG